MKTRKFQVDIAHGKVTKRKQFPLGAMMTLQVMGVPSVVQKK